MANTKLSALTTETTFASTDYLVKIKSAAGGDVKVLMSDFVKAFYAASADPYKFRVHLTTATNTGNGAAVKIPFNVKDTDTSSNFDNVTNFRFTAPIAGFYSFFGRASTSNSASTSRIITYLYKNGSAVSRGSDTTAQFAGSVVTDMFPLAANDYVELWVFGSTALALDVSDTTTCYFGGFLLSAT